MTPEEIEANIREYIKKTPHMSLATSRDNKPWVCEVHFAYDEQLHVYFVSKTLTRHAQEILLNPNVAGNIVKQHALTELPHGIYFEGRAEMLNAPSDTEIERYCQLLDRNVEELKKQLKEEDGRRMYKITVGNWAIFGKFDGDATQKYTLSWGDN